MISDESRDKLREIMKASEGRELDDATLDLTASQIMTLYLAQEARRIESGEFWNEYSGEYVENI